MMEKYLYLKGTDPECSDVFDELEKETLRPRILGARICLFVPCSWGKPYSQSYIHYMINMELWRKKLFYAVDRWHISNAGVIPSAMEDFGIPDRYAFFAYDWNSRSATHEEGEYIIKKIESRLRRWKAIFGLRYERIVCYLRPKSKTLCAVRDVFPEIENLCAGEIVEKSYPPLYREEPDIVLIQPQNLDRLSYGVEKILLDFEAEERKRSQT